MIVHTQYVVQKTSSPHEATFLYRLLKTCRGPVVLSWSHGTGQRAVPTLGMVSQLCWKEAICLRRCVTPIDTTQGVDCPHLHSSPCPVAAPAHDTLPYIASCMQAQGAW